MVAVKFDTEVRNAMIFRLWQSGVGFAQLGKRFGVSRQRALQIVRAAEKKAGRDEESRAKDRYAARAL
jgi:hypothetical protein